MSYPHFFVSKKHKDGVSQVQLQLDLYELLKNIGDSIKKDGVFVPEVLRPLVDYIILETVVGPSHLAFLLNDGRVCRVAFSLLEDKLVFLSERKKGRNPDIGRDSSLSRDGNSGSARSSGNAAALRSLRGSMSVMGRPRGSLNILRDLQRGGSMYFRPPIAASEIPEEFIEQCQMVLQGKSRQAIVRELQRTNLDVNAAVNNLLSREDESDFNNASGPPGFDDDWGDDTMDVFSILQQSEGLLMENEGDIPDEFIDRTAVPRFRREILMDCDRSLGDHATYTDRRKRRRFESNLLRNSENFRSGESGRSIWPYLGISDDKEEEINQDGSTGKGAVSYIQLGDRLEFWTTISAESPPSHFTAIAALYTELVAINSRGELHQWKWQSPEPYNPHNIYSQPFNLDQPESGHTVNHRHPRAANLGISHEKIISLSGCITRASIITSSGAVATWVDEILTALFHSIVPASSAVLNAASLALSRLEHPATYFSELKNEKVVHLSVAPLISVVQCASGDVYWWGVLPSYIRQKNADKQKNITGSTITTNETTRHQTASEGPEVAAKITNAPSLNPGDLVCMRNAPMFHAGAVGFTLINGIPKVGVLLEDSWKLTDVCRFRVKSPSSLKSFPTEKLHVTISGKSSNSASTEAAHALICPYAQEIAAAYAAAAASQGEHESTQLDTGSVEMPPPPSPASSTCSDQSGPVKVSPGTFKRKKVPSNSSDSGNLPSTSRSDSLQQSVPSASQQPSTKQQPFASKSSGQSKISHDEEIEDWCLSDVHFVEDGRNQPVGVLMKLDGNIAAVKFLKEQDRACLAARCPASPVCQFINYISKSGTNATVGKPFPVPGTTSSQSSSACVLQDPFFWINDCRLLNKSDIVQVKQPSGGGLPQRVPDFVQPTPRYITMGFLASKLPTPAHSNSSTNVIKKKIISLAPENSRIHAIVGRCSTDDLATAAMCHLEYHVFTLNGKTVSSRRLPALANKAGIHLDGGSEDSSSYSNITLTSPSERPLLLRDSAGVVFPFLPPSRPGQESWVFPPWLDLPPVQCAALAWINTSRNSSSASSQDRKLSVSEGDTRNTGTGNASVDKKSSSVPTRLQNDSRLLFGVVVTRETSLLQHIIRTDEVKVEETLRSLAAAAPSRLETIACEMADGHRTILHMAVLMCAPLVRETQEMTNVIENILKRTSTDGSTADGSGWTTIPPSSTQQPSSSLPKSIQSILNLAPGAQRSSSAGSTSSSIHDFFIRSSIEAAAAASSGTSGATTETTLTPSNSYFCHLPSLTSVEESSRRPAAHRIFRALMDNKRLRRLMPKLLSSLSDDSLTPFMLAVQCKAYQVAQYILDFLIEMEGIRSDGSEESRYQFRYARLMRYLYPSSARLDDSPLFNLAYNDTCSFTWTGPKHIRQDIFECRTCGLMDSLCCCSECARVCHKGHDCRLKRTSPTAYCDCWEKCRCRSLISGHQDIRKELFKRLLDYTDMVYLPNRLNDHLLVYLTRRVVRQWKEQKQFKSMRRHGGGGERNRGAGGNSPNSDEPEHDLDPPVFSRQALEITLDSKAAVASLLCDCKQVFLSYPHGRYEDKKNKSADSPCVQAIQSGTAILDEFVFLLICKYPAEFVQRLVNTLARTLSEHLNGDSGVRQLMTLTFSSNPPPNTSNNAFYYCQKGIARFVRSVARIYTGLMLSLAPDHNKKKSRINGSQANTLELIRSIFSQLAPVALPELTALATKIISPVRTGALLSTRPFELSSQLQDAIHASYNQFSFEQLISSEKSGNNSRSRQAQSNVPFYHSSGHGPDCPNIVIRHLIYGFDGSDGTSSAILPTWINIKRQLTPVASTSEQKSEQAMEVDDPPSLTSRSKRRRQESINSDSPQTKHRRRHHRKRHRHGDSNASTGGSDPPAPPPSQPPVIVVEPVATTVTNTSNASNTFAEMELTVPGDSDTDGDVRSNELDSNATTTVEPHQHRMEEEYFSETASEDETISRSQLEAPGSQHSSISSTAATAGTTGSVILDSLDTSRREQQNESTANTTLEEGESTMIVTPYCGSDEEEDEMMAEEGNANAQGMQGLAASIRRSISRRQNREERRRQQQRRFASINDDDEVANEDTEEEDDESDMSGEEGDEEISVESGEDSEDSDDSESDSESDDSDEEEGDVEGEDESVSETEEEDEEEDMEEEEVERDLSVMDDDDNEQENERDDDEEAYSQESDSSPPPSPWIRRRLGGGGSGAGGQAGQGSSSTTATTQGGGNGNAGGAGEVSSANTSQNLTPTTATTSVSRPISSSGSVMARLYSAALSSAFDRRNVRGTSLNALNGWTPFGAPLSPSPTDPSTAPVGSNTNSSSNAVTSAATTANNNNSEAQANPDANEMKNGGIHVTEVQLSRAMGTLLRLIADVMADLVNQDGENVEEEGDDTDGHLRRSVSAPVLLTPPVGMVVPRKWRALTRNRGGMVQTPTGCILTPLRSLVVARPADSVGRALICAGVGSILEPIWDWISECLCDLEARLRARASWNEIRPDIPAVEFFSGDYGKSKPRKDITITGPHQNVKSSQNQGSTVGPTESAILIGSSEGDSGIVAIETTTEGGGPMKGSANRAQTLNYVISLMRSLHNEHDSHVPAVDISSYKHSAYIVDAFIYFFRVFEGTWPSGLSYHLVRHRDSLPESMQVVDEFSQLRSRLFQGHPLTQRTHSFFRRSMSTLCINAPPVDAILNPAAESLPLAVTPQVLEPEAERSTYFSVDKNNKIYSDFSKLEEDAHSSLAKDSRPQHSSRIGKNVNFEQRIICGGEFLDSVCHTGSTMMRWSRSLNAFASAFSTDISVEPRSYMVERLSFTAKEARFRKDMERLRSCTKYDLSLEIDRDPSALILNTATQLNNELSSRLAQSAAYGNSLLMRDSGSVSDLLRFHHETAAIASGAISPQVSSNLLNFPSSSSSGIPVLLSRRVKVVFRGEPGEGSGVTRSFISSFAEAVTADTHLPDLSPLYLNAISRNVHQEALNNPRAATPTSLMVAATSRLFNRLRIPLSSNSNSTTFASSTANNAVTTMTATTGSGSNITQATNTSSSSVPSGSAAAVSRSRRSEIQAMRNYFRSPYTSISINLATPMNTQSEEPTESNISPEPTAITMPVATTETVETTTAPSAPGVSPIDSPERDPLLWQPGHSGFFSPRGIPSNLSPDSPAFRARMDLYRCIGRVVALSLLHSEICPISFNRHVLKYILGRPLCWHDFAFYNVDLFEGLRQVLLPVARGENSDIVSDFGLNFSLVLAPEEGGNVANPSLQLHQLVSGGDGIDVDAETVFEYVKRYAEFKMLDVAKDALEQIRLGVFDVLPVNALDGLTPEDLRLLLNGITDIDVDMLSGYTTFIDESNCGASLATEGGGQQGGGGSDSGTDYGGTAPNIPNPAKDRIERLKRWFWHVVRGMNPRQRQDLLYFWTSSPALPPSALGFEPSPTIVIRPADDQHLPTANTCISRLYLPLYSSRQILREKLLSAIETRSFGFV
nr:E3 ubiquitin protein ligase hyd [Hymenolepis microstoma]